MIYPPASAAPATGVATNSAAPSITAITRTSETPRDSDRQASNPLVAPASRANIFDSGKSISQKLAEARVGGGNTSQLLANERTQASLHLNALLPKPPASFMTKKLMSDSGRFATPDLILSRSEPAYCDDRPAMPILTLGRSASAPAAGSVNNKRMRQNLGEEGDHGRLRPVMTPQDNGSNTASPVVLLSSSLGGDIESDFDELLRAIKEGGPDRFVIYMLNQLISPCFFLKRGADLLRVAVSYASYSILDEVLSHCNSQNNIINTKDFLGKPR